MASIKLTGDTSGEITISAPAVAGTNTITLPATTGTLLDTNSNLSASKLTGTLPAIDGSALTGIASGAFSTHLLLSGTTFVPKSTSTKMYVGVYGSTGGSSAFYGGGPGGAGFSEKYYSGSLAASYSFAIGAGGSSATGSAGGTTSFDVMSVTGGGGVTGNTGSSGGVGSGGDFNATGGTGGDGNGTDAGGGGGDATRAGNGGNGANFSGTSGGGGGGTGGNNASGTVEGAAATSADPSALDLGTILGGYFTETFMAGRNGGGSVGGYGAPAYIYTSELYILYYNGKIVGNTASSFVGQPGFIIVVEW